MKDEDFIVDDFNMIAHAVERAKETEKKDKDKS